ncbi:MAG TPA: DUF5693 family protein [Limnochordia bacterium]|nr:DUF5693 family protein [Limnochordia bacterium]
MKRVLWVIILFAIVTSLGVFIQRWSIEIPNSTVEIVYDLPALLELGANRGIQPEALLADLKLAGVTTIAVQPTSVAEMMLDNRALPADVRAHLLDNVTEVNRFLTLPVQFESEQLELVSQSGLKVAPKLNTSPWDLDPIWLAYDPELIIVSGQGIMDMESFYGSGATLALVEFATPQINPADPSTMLRLHGISAREMEVLSDERILNRYMRAVKERNMRVLYVRPFVEGADSWERSLHLLGSLQVRLQNAGFSVGVAQPFPLWNVAWIWTAVVAAGIWAASLWYAVDLFPRWRRLIFWLGLMALGLSLVLLALKPTLGRQGLALVAAIVFPSLAMQLDWGKTPLTRYISISLVSMVGALFVVALLSGTEFLLKIQEFRGVKIMHIAPIALVVFTLVRPLGDWLKRSIPVPYLLLAGVLGLMGVFYVLRTGNFGLPVLGLEIKAREFLENLLIVRPRTKELFLGHPALYLALNAKEPRRSWWLPIAVIGQISLVNTFTHTHTFLWVSLLRTCYGLLFGYVLGWLISKALSWGKGRLGDDFGVGLLRIR